MISYLLAGPALEPVTLAKAKAFLRVDDTVEDALIETLITAARLHIESTTGRALIAQTWRVVLDCWPAERVLRLPVSPLIGLTTVTAYDAQGAAHAIALAQFQSEAAPARLLLPQTIDGMPVMRERQGIEIDYAAGHGSAAGDVPADLRQALLVLVSGWFEHRDAADAAEPPAAFHRLVAPYRSVRL
ncbi:MAG: head-tail connector protein [Devosia sp.]|nr:head-tail connector protein [Devosia sp.]